MSPKSEEQFKEIREGRKQQILDAALELFAENGYTNTSISSIAKKATISKGLIYNYFESKEALVTKIMRDGLLTMTESFDTNKDGVLTSSEMENYLITIFKSLRENPNFWKLYFTLFMQPKVMELIKEEAEKMMKEVFTLTYNYFVSEGFEEPETETILFGAALDGLGFQYVLAPDVFPLQNIEKILIKKYCKK